MGPIVNQYYTIHQKNIPTWSCEDHTYNTIFQDKFDLFRFQRFGNRFGDAKGAAYYEAYFLHRFCNVFKFFENYPFFKPFGKKTRVCSTGLETGCKPVLLKRVAKYFEVF